MTRSQRVLVCTAALLVLGIGLGLWLMMVERPGKPIRNAREGLPGKRAQANERLVDGEEDFESGARDDASSNNADAVIRRAMEEWDGISDPEHAAAVFKRLREELLAIGDPAASEAVRKFMKGGQDVLTSLPFVVGPGGSLQSAPTMRTALLDLLPSLDPEIALAVSRGVMNRATSADEYALGLRNLAWSDFEGSVRDELGDRFEQMLEIEEWRANPSPGFLEALDAAVEVGDVRRLQVIANLANQRGDSAALLARASFIAMDRMVIRNPELLEQVFQSDPRMSPLTADQRASLMSRIDITRPSGRKVFEQYLSSAVHDPEELEYFSSLFPNGNRIQGNWLITGSEAGESIEDRAALDRAILKELEGLTINAAEDEAAAALDRIRQRLLE